MEHIAELSRTQTQALVEGPAPSSKKVSTIEQSSFAKLLGVAEAKEEVAIPTRLEASTSSRASEKNARVDDADTGEEEKAPRLASDLNGDGVVDLQDLNMLLSMLGSGKHEKHGDINGDGVVNFWDLVQLLNDFGSTQG